MEKFILDTNVFFNIEAGFNLGKNTNETMSCFIYYAKKLMKKVEFYMPPLIVDEFLSFFKDKNQPIIKETLSFIKVKTPEKNKIKFSAPVFYSLINDVRKRSYQGLNLGEELIKKTGLLFLEIEKKLNKKEFEIQIGSLIKNFRERYRQITRFGFLDSVADLDLIVLTKENDGYLVSADEGVITWGRVFGVKEMPPRIFRAKLDGLLQSQKEDGKTSQQSYQ